MTTKTATPTDKPAGDKGEAAAKAAQDEKIVPIQPEDTEVEHSAPQSEADPAPAAAKADKDAEGEGEASVQHNRHAQKLTEREQSRKRAAERFKELRAQELEAKGKAPPRKLAAEAEPGEGEAEPAPARAEPKMEPKTEREPVRTEARKAADKEVAPGEPAALPAKVVLKVDGREEEVTLDEALSRARKYTAGEKRLDKAKGILHDAIRAANNVRGNGHAASQPPAPSAPESQPEPAANARVAGEPQDPDPSHTRARPESQPRNGKVDRDKLKTLVERIQVGDTDEGADALAEAMEIAVQSANARAANPDTLRQLTRDEIVNQRIVAENSAALKEFGKDFPELAEDSPKSRLLSKAVVSALCEELTKDLVDIGVTETEISPFRSDEKALLFLRNRAKAEGLQVRDATEVFGAIGNTLVETFNLRSARQEQPSPQQNQSRARAQEPDPALQERLDRKRAAPQQPRTAGVRAPAPQPPAPRTKEQYLQDLRRSRGFPVTR